MIQVLWKDGTHDYWEHWQDFDTLTLALNELTKNYKLFQETDDVFRCDAREIIFECDAVSFYIKFNNVESPWKVGLK